LIFDAIYLPRYFCYGDSDW